MTTQPENKLLEAIDKLTLGYIVRTPIDGEDDHVEHHDALIVQLRAAIASDVSGGAGGAQARERVPLDLDAAARYENIDGQVGAFLLEWAGVRPAKGSVPENTLRTAYAAFIGKAGDTDVQRATRQWEGWVKQIEDKLSGLVRLELMAPCPECGFQWYVNADGDQEVALIVTYRADGKKGLSESFAVCRFCEHLDTPSVWKGTRRLRELAYALESHGHDTPMLNELVYATESDSAEV